MLAIYINCTILGCSNRFSVNVQGKVTGEEGWISLGAPGNTGTTNTTYNTKTYKADGPILQITVRLLHLDSGIVRYTRICSISFQSESRDGVVIGSSEHFGSPEQGGGYNGATVPTLDLFLSHLNSTSLALFQLYLLILPFSEIFGQFAK